MSEPLPFPDQAQGNSLTSPAIKPKPIAFNIPLSSSQERKIKKKKGKSITLKNKQLTLDDIAEDRSRKPLKTPGRKDRPSLTGSNTKRNFSQRNSPSQDSLAKVSKKVSNDPFSSPSLGSSSLSVPSEGQG